MPLKLLRSGERARGLSSFTSASTVLPLFISEISSFVLAKHEILNSRLASTFV